MSADVTDRAAQKAQRATPGDIPSWVEAFARLGYAAKGLVYIIVGILAAQAALGTGGQTTDTQGALRAIITQPYGRVLLAIVAVGLFGYALWRFVQAVIDPEDKGTDPKGLVQRGSYIVSGAAYGALALTAAQLVLGTGGGQGNSPEDWTARLMSQPYGVWLVILIGIALVGGGIAQLYRGYTAEFKKRFKFGEMSEAEREWIPPVGRFGLAARGVTLGLIGLFFIQAGWQHNPNQAGGLGQALVTLARQPYGPWLLAIVAIGLIAYGLYSAATARYRRIVIQS